VGQQRSPPNKRLQPTAFGARHRGDFPVLLVLRAFSGG
jgi:hypothetical protein